MTTLFTAVVIAGLLPTLPADESTPRRDNEKPAPSLKLGDAAPRLTVTKWLRGEPVEKFEPGKVYVVHFWAAWCAPCIGHMPHLAELHDRYKDRGVTVISFTSRDIRGVPSSEEQVTALIKRRGAALKLHYPLAYSDDGTTADAWLKASGQIGWCTFVVDKAGRIAFMGSSMFLDLVLPKVLAGTDPKVIGDEMANVVTEYEAVYETLTRDFRAGRGMKPGLAAVKAFEAKYPPLTDLPPIVQAKLSLLPKYGEPGEAKAYAAAIVADGIKRGDVRLLALASSILRNETANKDSLALAVKAAEECVRIHGGNDARSLLDLAGALLASGDKAKAKEVARRAVEAAAAETPAVREEVEKESRQFGAEK